MHALCVWKYWRKKCVVLGPCRSHIELYHTWSWRCSYKQTPTTWHQSKLTSSPTKISDCFLLLSYLSFPKDPLEGQTSKWLVVPRWNQQHHVPGVELVVFVTNEVRRKRHCYNLVTSQNPRIFLGEEDGKVVRKNGWCFRNPAKQLRER